MGQELTSAALIVAPPGASLALARRRGRFALAAGALAAVAVLAAAAVQTAFERGNQLELWRRVAESDVRSIAAHVRQSVQAADTLAHVVGDEVEAVLIANGGALPGDGSPLLHRLLRARKDASPGVAMISVADPSGRVLAFSHAHPAQGADGVPIDVSKAAFFKALRDDPARALSIGTPLRNHVDGGWRFHVARPLRGAGGQLAGVVFVGLDVDAFARVYSGLAISGKSFRVFHEAGAMMFRWPPATDDQVGEDYSKSASLQVFRSGAPSAVFERGQRGRNDASARELRIVAPVAVGDYPLVVSVRLDESLVLAAWQRTALATWSLASALALLLLVAGWTVRRGLLRGAAAAASLAESAERLARQEADARKLALIAQRTDNAVVLTDRAGLVTWVNEGFERITGFTAAEILGRRPGALLQGPLTDPETRRRIRGRLERGEGFEEVILNYRRDGQPYWLAIEVQGIQDAAGVMQGFMAIERDVTAERVALASLRTQNAAADLLSRAGTFAEALPALLRLLQAAGDWRLVQAWAVEGGQLVWRAGCDSPIEPAPAFAAASRGTPLRTSVGAPGRAWASGEAAEQRDAGADATDPRASSARTDGVRDAWCVPVHVEGRVEGVLELAGRRAPVDDPALGRSLSTFADMLGQFIARRAAERRRREAAEATARAVQAKSRFIATASHEIRTPLNAVVGIASLMDAEPLPPGMREQVGVLRDAADQLRAVVNDVLDLSRLESGRVERVREPFDLRRTIAQAMRVARALPGAAAIEVSSRVDDALPLRVVGDERRVSQVLLNLLGNAVKFTRAGSVELSVSAAPSAASTQTVTFAVRDSGVGIAAENLQRIFEPFEQVGREPGAAAGTGLGLAICRRIATLLEGSIDVVSQPGVGSTFRFAVPFERAGALPEPVARAAPAPQSRLRVLLAEDTPASQLVARLILERLGHEVTVVDDGDVAVQAVSERTFDVVFLDIQMPRMSGFEAAAAMRAMGDAGQRLRIFGMSAMAQDSDRARALEVGMDDYLVKPVRLEDVRRTLQAQAA